MHGGLSGLSGFGQLGTKATRTFYPLLYTFLPFGFAKKGELLPSTVKSGASLGCTVIELEAKSL
jgi:hypothetical protein